MSRCVLICTRICLKLGLRGVKRDLLVMLTKCNDQACQDVLSKYEIGKLDANGIHYDQVIQT